MSAMNRNVEAVSAEVNAEHEVPPCAPPQKQIVKRKVLTVVAYVLVYVFLFFMAFICLLPFWLLLVNSTRGSIEIQSGLSFWFGSALGENYTTLSALLAESSVSIWGGFLNSLIVSLCSAALSVFFSAATAYGFTGYNFRGKKFLFGAIMVILMVPSQLGIIGFYQMCNSMSLIDSYVPLIIPAIATASCVFFMKQYLEANFPFEIVQAARIDGSGELRTFICIVFPLMLPAVATMGIMGIIGAWNNFMGPLMILNDPAKFTLPLMVNMLKGNIYSAEYGANYLGLMMSVLPLLIIYLCLSKYIIRGVSIGGTKE